MKRKLKQSNRKAVTNAVATLQFMKPRLHANKLTADDLTILLGIVEGILADRDVRDGYWYTARGAPEVDYQKKLNAVIDIAMGKGKIDDERFEKVAEARGLGPDVVKHAWRKTGRRPTPKASKKQSDK